MRLIGCRSTTGGGARTDGAEPCIADAPTSLLDGVEAAVCGALAIRSLKHRSALLELCRREAFPPGAVAAAYDVIAENWRRCAAAGVGSRSAENWRWRVPQLQIGSANASPEVRLERALIGACERAGRADWANQVPVASGIAGASRERRRAIDLVHEKVPGRFELIELKVASDTPLYAAFEIVGHVCIWLLSRAGPDAPKSQLLSADAIEAKVLAPAPFYARYDQEGLRRLAVLLDSELSALGAADGVPLGFGFETFEPLAAQAPWTDAAMLALLDQRAPL
jgi:hypothetical protein